MVHFVTSDLTADMYDMVQLHWGALQGISKLK
jgi:hypothetical protein